MAPLEPPPPCARLLRITLASARDCLPAPSHLPMRARTLRCAARLSAAERDARLFSLRPSVAREVLTSSLLCSSLPIKALRTLPEKTFVLDFLNAKIDKK